MSSFSAPVTKTERQALGDPVALWKGTAFGWCTSDPDNPGARWRFELESIAGAVRLRYRVLLGPGPSGISAAIESMPDKEPRILQRRIDEHRANMQAVVDGIKELAEG